MKLLKINDITLNVNEILYIGYEKELYGGGYVKVIFTNKKKLKFACLYEEYEKAINDYNSILKYNIE